MKPTKTTRFILCLAVLAVLTGCQAETEFEPIPAEEIETTDEQATNELAGVTMVVDGEAWQGETELAGYATPLFVEITNGSDVPLSLEYSRFFLVGAMDEYRALPVFEYDMIHSEPMLTPEAAVIADPEITAAGFLVAPYFAAVYPTLEPFDSAIVLDESYYGEFVTVWGEIEALPSLEMQLAVVPEGVLPPGAEISGFLFFEPVAEGEEKVNFMAQLESVETGELVGTMNVPLEPEVELELEP